METFTLENLGILRAYSRTEHFFYHGKVVLNRSYPNPFLRLIFVPEFFQGFLNPVGSSHSFSQKRINVQEEKREDERRGPSVPLKIHGTSPVYLPAWIVDFYGKRW